MDRKRRTRRKERKCGRSDKWSTQEVHFVDKILKSVLNSFTNSEAARAPGFSRRPIGAGMISSACKLRASYLIHSHLRVERVENTN